MKRRRVRLDVDHFQAIESGFFHVVLEHGSQEEFVRLKFLFADNEGDVAVGDGVGKGSRDIRNQVLMFAVNWYEFRHLILQFAADKKIVSREEIGMRNIGNTTTELSTR